MALTYFLAQLMGITLALFAVAGLVGSKRIMAAVHSFDRESFSTLAIGYIAMVAGLAIVLSHNVWDGSWKVIVTLFGWASLLKGFTYLIAPKKLLSLSSFFMKDESRMRMWMVAILLLGIYLAYKGFGY